MIPKTMMGNPFITVYGAGGQTRKCRILSKMKKTKTKRHPMVFVPGNPKSTVLSTGTENDPRQDIDNYHDNLLE
jgi:hypothetical protein